MSTQRCFNPVIELMERNEIKNLQKKLEPVGLGEYGKLTITNLFVELFRL